MRRLWDYRDFIWSSVKREFQSKYKNSLLGALWTVLNPLAMILIYTVIFSQIMSAKLPGINSDYAYGIYICSGILSWGLFSEIVSRGQTIFIENANILKKLNFPRVTLPLIMVIGACINFSIIFILFILFLLLSNQFPGIVIFTIIPVLFIQILLSVGLGISLGVLNVFFRDIGQLFTLILQFWFWLTPIVYPLSILPEHVKNLILVWNPLSPIINGFQAILVYKQPPDWHSLLIPSLIGVMLCTLAIKLFRSHANEMVDEL